MATSVWLLRVVQRQSAYTKASRKYFCIQTQEHSQQRFVEYHKRRIYCPTKLLCCFTTTQMLNSDLVLHRLHCICDFLIFLPWPLVNFQPCWMHGSRDGSGCLPVFVVSAQRSKEIKKKISIAFFLDGTIKRLKHDCLPANDTAISLSVENEQCFQFTLWEF